MPKKFKVQKAGFGSMVSGLIGKILNRVDEQNIPQQYYNLNLTSPKNSISNYTNSITSPNTMNASNVDVMDASKVKTMSHGGSIEVGKGKDYIKDLI
jgi:hypothetical protein